MPVEEEMGRVGTRYIVIGSAGMLGTDLVDLLRDIGASVQGLDVEEVDIRSEENTRHVLSLFEPGVVINLAALTDVDGCETTVDEAFGVNSLGPKNLAMAAAEFKHVLVQLSTDYVFDGTQRIPYKEDDPMNPLGIYGKSKAQGEQYIREVLSDGHCIIRTSWLYGLHGKNFIEAILDAAAKRDVLKVVNDQHGRPTYTRDLSKAVIQLCQLGARGTFHVTNSGEATWYDFAVRIVQKAGIRNVRVETSTTEELGRPAPRPRYSVLDNSKFVQLAGSPLRNWEQALDNYLALREQKARFLA